MTVYDNPESPAWALRVLKGMDFSDVRRDWRPVDFTDSLGCGHYGCVLTVDDPNVVMKLTTDPTEVRFIKQAMSFGEWPEGIVEYLAIAKTGKQHRKRDVWAIWREAAFDVGLDLRPTGDKYVDRAVRDFSDRLWQFKTQADNARKILQRAKNPEKTLDEAKRFEDWAWNNVALEDAEGADKRGNSLRLSRYKGGQALAARLRACAVLAEMMEHTYLSDLVGSALGYYLEKGLLLADVHSQNVGQVRRDGETMWVITDPGHAVEVGGI